MSTRLLQCLYAVAGTPPPGAGTKSSAGAAPAPATAQENRRRDASALGHRRPVPSGHRAMGWTGAEPKAGTPIRHDHRMRRRRPRATAKPHWAVVSSVARHPDRQPGSIRRGAGGGYERGRAGGGGGGVWLGPPSSYGPPMVPAEGREIFSSLKPLGAEGAEAKVWLSAQTLEEEEGGGGPGGTPLLLRRTAVLIHSCRQPLDRRPPSHAQPDTPRVRLSEIRDARRGRKRGTHRSKGRPPPVV